MRIARPVEFFILLISLMYTWETAKKLHVYIFAALLIPSFRKEGNESTYFETGTLARTPSGATFEVPSWTATSSSDVTRLFFFPILSAMT